MRQRTLFALLAAVGGTVLAGAALATSDGGAPERSVEAGDTASAGRAGGLLMPMMNPARGRRLFAAKGCVVCHSVNGVGGEDAPPLDFQADQGPMNPFEFAARMWRGAEAMIYVQQEELGEQILLTGDELADIVAFVHSPDEQKRFSDADIPPRIVKLMRHLEEAEAHEDESGHGSDAEAATGD